VILASGGKCIGMPLSSFFRPSLKLEMYCSSLNPIMFNGVSNVKPALFSLVGILSAPNKAGQNFVWAIFLVFLLLSWRNKSTKIIWRKYAAYERFGPFLAQLLEQLTEWSHFTHHCSRILFKILLAFLSIFFENVLLKSLVAKCTYTGKHVVHI
jgi:hypothetical protein